MHRPRRPSEDGQMSLVIAMMTTTFLFLTAFALGVGMLVHAKINLQNAADLAAYSGAAVQARQLTHISYLNYEMRRQLKKYLFRYYVVGNYAQPNFPTAATTNNQAYAWDVGSGPTAKHFGVPVVCIMFSPEDNYCQNPTLRNVIQGYTANPLDPIGTTLRDALEKVERIRQANCDTIGVQNETAQKLWLFNTDPTISSIPGINGADPAAVKFLNNLRSVAQGLGLIPRELLLSMRIGTLKSYVNAPSLKNLTLGGVSALKSAADPAQNERSIQSFMSAYYNLGPNTFDSGSVSMNELMPNELLRLNPISVEQFDSYYTVVQRQNNGDCIAAVYPLFVTGNLPIGFTKDPQILTYYAISLEAEANLLFLGRVRMKAMAAAQPFGSRIGPAIEVGSSAFSTGGKPNPTLFAGAGPTSGNTAYVLASGVLPNLPVYEQDNSSTSGGWNQVSVLGSMRGLMRSLTTGNQISSTTMRQLQDYAMAPTPWERGKYNIPTSFPDPFVVNFDSQDLLAFWAPILPLEQAGDLSNQLRARVTDLLSRAGGHSTINGGNSGGVDPLVTLLGQALETYVTRELTQGKGEDGEGFKIARIHDPLKTRDPQGRVVDIHLPQVVMDQVRDIKDSFVPEHLNAQPKQWGRTGYSVKLVSFKQLMSPSGASSDGETPWINFPGGDPDLPSVEH